MQVELQCGQDSLGNWCKMCLKKNNEETGKLKHGHLALLTKLNSNKSNDGIQQFFVKKLD